jgi:hypothetical protein
MGIKVTHLAFQLGITGVGSEESNEIRKSYQAAFDFDKQEDMNIFGLIIRDGLSLFENLLGYRALLFSPANGLFNHQLDDILAENHIKLINVGKIEKEPMGNSRYKKSLHFMGSLRKSGLINIVRNVLFEPSKDSNIDWIDKCLNDIQIAFRYNNPAIISSHRVNFSGFIDSDNRSHGLLCLQELLNLIIKYFPDIEFISASELYDIIDGNYE